MPPLNRRTAFLLSLVFGLAVVAIVMAMTRPPRTAEANAPTTVQIVVAAQDISPRTTIRSDMLARRTVDLSAASRDSLRDISEAAGKVSMRQLQKGQPILESDVAAAGPQLGLSYNLRPNQRAVTVPIDPVSGVAGFLKPGDHVDVIATYSAQDQNVTRTVLQNVELLAIGSQPATTSRADERANRAETDAPTATLAVSTDQMDTLALIAAKAKIHLALRSPDDKAVTPPAPITTRAVFGVGEQPTPVAAPAAVQPAMPVQPMYAQPAPRQNPPGPRPSPSSSHAANSASTVVVTRGTDTQTVPVH